MKKIISLFLLLNLVGGICFADDRFDDSIDGAIRTKYNTKKIEDDLLPDLPKSLQPFDDYTDDAFSPSPIRSQIQNTTSPSTKSQIKTTQPTRLNTYNKNNVRTSAVLTKGKKFRVKLQGSVSDKTAPGTRITFVSQYPESFRYITIPSGTVFKGKVTDSHPPYLSGNGGLIVIEVNELIYKGTAYEIDAKISLADDRHIFFNNIKGKRKYMKNTWNSTSFGSKFLKKTWKSSCKHVNKGGAEILLAPFTLAGGLVVYCANVISSPVLALFTKGGSISIPSGSRFVIQLRDDAVILK